VGALVGWVGYSIWESRRSTRAASADESAETPPPASLAPRLLDLGAIVLGLVLLVIGARWLVDGAVAVALGLGLSSLVIGLTVVAIGTSLPELATSIIASIRGQRDIAVGNVVGSNIFNLLAVLGITAIIVDIPVAPGALAFDFPVMVAVAGASLPIFFTGGRIGRREGALFVAYGIGYTVYLVATATEHTGLTSLTEAIATVALPLTAVTLYVIAVRELQRRRDARTGEPAPG
jgi:cation:H+ antiporter